MASISTIPEPLDLEVYAGDENRIEFEIRADGIPVDLTGATLTAQARVSVSDTSSTPLEAEFVEVDYALGKIAMTWDGEKVRALIMAQPVQTDTPKQSGVPLVRKEMQARSDVWTGVWDLQLLMPQKPLPTTLLRGKFTATLDVTRP